MFHIIDDDFMEKEKHLEFYINDIRKIINIDKNRKIYSSKANKYDIMIIKLKQEDEIKDFLEIDPNIFSKNSELSYKDEPIYILHRPFKDTLVSYGIGIEKINDYDIRHKCNTQSCSSGGPILNQLSHKVIGIHKAYIKNKKYGNYNIGTFLKFPLIEFQQLNLKKNTNSEKENDNKFSIFTFKNLYTYRSINKEYNDLNSCPLANLGIMVGLFDEDNISEWNVFMSGAIDTAYSGGFFRLKLKFPEDYPNRAPEIIFLTPIYHLNVNFFKSKESKGQSLGYVCTSICNRWYPETTAKELLTRLYAIFYFQNPHSCYDYSDFRRRKEFLNNHALFESKAKYFTKKYANATIFGKYDNYDNEDWDFSYNEKEIDLIKKPKEIEKRKEINYHGEVNNSAIFLNFSYNGKSKIFIQCQKNEKLYDVIKRFNIKLNKSNESNVLYIRGRKRLLERDFSRTIGELGFQDSTEITYISNFVFA